MHFNERLTSTGKKGHSEHVDLPGTESISRPADEDETKDSTDLLSVIDSGLPVRRDGLDTIGTWDTESSDVGRLSEVVVHLNLSLNPSVHPLPRLTRPVSIPSMIKAADKAMDQSAAFL